jgi:hypothetical protein
MGDKEEATEKYKAWKQLGLLPTMIGYLDPDDPEDREMINKIFKLLFEGNE